MRHASCGTHHAACIMRHASGGMQQAMLSDLQGQAYTYFTRERRRMVPHLRLYARIWLRLAVYSRMSSVKAVSDPQSVWKSTVLAEMLVHLVAISTGSMQAALAHCKRNTGLER